VRSAGQTAPHFSWSLAKAWRLTARCPWQFRFEFGWSLAIAQLSAGVGLLIATPLAFWATRSRIAAMIAFTLTAICLALPGPVVGLGIVRFFTALPGSLAEYLYSRTLAAPVLALSIKCFPLTMGIVWSGLRRAEREMFDTARLAGASPWQQLVKLALPTRSALLLCAFLASVVFNLGDLAASILVVPPGVSTLAIRVFGLIHYGVEDRLAALCLATMGILFLFGVLVVWAFGAMRRQR
jgi:iron(III) transport system permease protein